jgi:centrosomal protein CEP104
MSDESIPFEIAHCSSFEQDYEPEHLIESSPGNQQQDPFQNVNHRGWQTERYKKQPRVSVLLILTQQKCLGCQTIHKI